MRQKLMLLFLNLCLISIIFNGCVTEKVIYKDVPADALVIKKTTLQKLMEETIYQKSLLLDCLERERVK